MTSSHTCPERHLSGTVQIITLSQESKISDKGLVIINTRDRGGRKHNFFLQKTHDPSKFPFKFSFKFSYPHPKTFQNFHTPTCTILDLYSGYEKIHWIFTKKFIYVLVTSIRTTRSLKWGVQIS